MRANGGGLFSLISSCNFTRSMSVCACQCVRERDYVGQQSTGSCLDYVQFVGTFEAVSRSPV
jgi:hypothetical protein